MPEKQSKTKPLDAWVPPAEVPVQRARGAYQIQGTQRFYQAARTASLGLEGSGLHMHLYDPLHHLIKAGGAGAHLIPCAGHRWSLTLLQRKTQTSTLFHRAP